jgi:hypothetical protein
MLPLATEPILSPDCYVSGAELSGSKLMRSIQLLSWTASNMQSLHSQGSTLSLAPS